MLRGTLIFTALVVLATPIALAQDEPTVNNSDYDTTPPADDQTYLDDAEMDSTAMSDSEFDTGVPAADESYLGEAEAQNAGTTSAKSDTPGIAVIALLGIVAVVALARPRR
ncbi:MAG TPA: hypothetical protein VM370_09310 [Candidatus Thermoplasmatota archaeon]|nr:hypothetical protein [Candidatus Thermoplasmatota archaeon]